MKKILNEWKKYVAEAEKDMSYGSEEFEKRFVEAFSKSIQDRDFIDKIKQAGFDMSNMSDKDIGQLQAGMSHTWYVKFGLEGAEFAIQEKIDRYLAEVSPEDKEYLENFFGKIFGELNSYKMNRIEKEYKRKAAWLGRHQMGDWWIADDGIDMFYILLKKSMGI